VTEAGQLESIPLGNVAERPASQDGGENAFPYIKGGRKSEFRDPRGRTVARRGKKRGADLDEAVLKGRKNRLLFLLEKRNQKTQRRRGRLCCNRGGGKPADEENAPARGKESRLQSPLQRNKVWTKKEGRDSTSWQSKIGWKKNGSFLTIGAKGGRGGNACRAGCKGGRVSVKNAYDNRSHKKGKRGDPSREGKNREESPRHAQTNRGNGRAK